MKLSIHKPSPAAVVSFIVVALLAAQVASTWYLARTKIVEPAATVEVVVATPEPTVEPEVASPSATPKSCKRPVVSEPEVK